MARTAKVKRGQGIFRPGIFLVLILHGISAPAAERYPDRFVWIFGWNLHQDSDVAAISKLLETAGQHGINGAVASFGFDTLCKQPPDYFRRLGQIKQACETNHIELIPALFSVGYGSGILSHNPNLAEGLPVENAPFIVHHGEARLAAADASLFKNGDFEQFTGNQLPGFNFYDQPGEISFVDTQIKHGGKASLRLENFTANPHGNGRIMQEVRVQPHRCYRLGLWVRTENLQPAQAFQIEALAGGRDIAPRSFELPATTDWRHLTMIVNSLDFDKLGLYAGLWGGKSGKIWLDDWTFEEIGPINVLRRPGTPVTVHNDDGTILYEEGKDYAPLQNPDFSPWRTDGAAAPLKISAGGRIHEGASLRVSWYHALAIQDYQVTVCMAEPELYEIFDHEARLLAEQLHPRRVLLNTDEVRMGGTCAACRGRDMARLLGECITKQAQAIRRYSPGARVYAWSDMLDPFHNGHGNYYLVNGDFTGAWKYVPPDLIMAVWGGEARPKDLRFFSDHGFETLGACYYDADDLNGVRGWLDAAKTIPRVRGFMYTPWLRKYDLLPAFGDWLNQPAH